MSFTSFLGFQLSPFPPNDFLPLRKHCEQQQHPVWNLSPSQALLGGVSAATGQLRPGSTWRTPFKERHFRCLQKGASFCSLSRRSHGQSDSNRAEEIPQEFPWTVLLFYIRPQVVGALFTRYPVASQSDLVSESGSQVKHESCPGVQGICLWDTSCHLI